MSLTKQVRWWVESRGIPQRPQVTRETEHHGNRKGGWTISAPLETSSVVYSFGIGRNISFELSLIAKYGVKVHAFDPTPGVREWLETRKTPPELLYHPIGVEGFDGTVVLHSNPDHREVSQSAQRWEGKGGVSVPVHRLSTVMEQLRDARVDLLKLDVEGSEYAVIDDLLMQRLPVGQILVEFHHRFPSIGRQKTIGALRALDRAGYRIFSVSASRREYGFIRE
jgi:FkbM family methyltransferase